MRRLMGSAPGVPAESGEAVDRKVAELLLKHNNCALDAHKEACDSWLNAPDNRPFWKGVREQLHAICKVEEGRSDDDDDDDYTVWERLGRWLDGIFGPPMERLYNRMLEKRHYKDARETYEDSKIIQADFPRFEDF